jgi:hypothetical protein
VVTVFEKKCALSAPKNAGRRVLYKTVVVGDWSCRGRPFLGGQLFVLSRTKLSHYGRAPLKYFLRFTAGITVHFAGEAKCEGSV